MSNKLILDKYIIDSDVETILNDVRLELSNGKLKTIKQTNSGFKVPCPCHSDGLEKDPSCFVQENGVWHCFACGEKGYIDKFVSSCFGMGSEFGKRWLIKRYGKLGSELDLDLEDINITENKIEAPVVLSEGILDRFESYHPYMDKRKLSRDVCERFKIKYDSKSQSLVFPVWDEKNRLVMLTRRCVYNKMFMIPSNVEKPVYLLNFVLTNGIKDVIVCESQINALYCWSLGFPAIALFGTGTSHQYDVLNKTDVVRYRLCLDGDNAGDKGRKRFRDYIRDDVFVDDIVIPRGKDINDLDKEEAIKLLGE